MKFIPVFTTEAGACLTFMNWQSVGIDTLALHLDALLMKPGLSYLENLNGLAPYIGWQGQVALNASLASPTRDGVYSLRSRFDGGLLQISSESLFALFLKLRPDILILPADLLNFSHFDWQTLMQSSQLFISATHYCELAAHLKLGKFYHHQENQALPELLQVIQQNNETAVYVAGEFGLEAVHQFSAVGVSYLESDKPASDAVKGQIYAKPPFALLDSEMACQYQGIDKDCYCPTCQQHLTRAYLHHLLLQTPLLAQRFLIQHNVHFYQNRSACLSKHDEIAQ